MKDVNKELYSVEVQDDASFTQIKSAGARDFKDRMDVKE